MALTQSQLIGEVAEKSDLSKSDVKAVLEAIIYVAEEPLTAAQLASALQLPGERVHVLLEQLGVLPARVDAVFINDPTAVQAEGYARARLAGRSLRIVGSRDFWCCSRLYVSSIPHDIPMWAVTFLRQLFGPVPPANNAKITHTGCR